MSIVITQPCILVVEGRDEENFFSALLDHLGIRDIQVLGIGGKTNLTMNLKALVHAPKFSGVVRVGIVRDADHDPEAARQSVGDSLRKAGLPVPPAVRQASDGTPVVAVLIVPDVGPGALEDICLSSVTADPAIPCLTAFFDCLEPLQCPPSHVGKAKVQAFLASRPSVGKRLGEAAQTGYWPWDAEAFAVVREFLGIVTLPA